MIDFSGVKAGLYEPGFGALMARRSVQTLVERFVRDGGRSRGAVCRPRWREGQLDAVALQSGERIAADHFVFALRPVAAQGVPRPAGPRSSPTRQEVFFFAPPAGDRRFRPRRNARAGPTSTAATSSTACPTSRTAASSSRTMRTGCRSIPNPGPRGRAGRAGRDRRAIRDRRFPLLANAPLTEARVCQYENSSNGDFLIDLHPRLTTCCWSAPARATASSTAPRSAATPPAVIGKAKPRAAVQPRDQGRKPEPRSALGL